MSNSIAPGSSAAVNVRVTALTTNSNVPAQYKTIILKKNLVNGVNTLTQEMMSAANAKYVIKYDYVLGENITVPANCVLEFDGGSLSNGTLKGNYTQINGCINCFNTNIVFAGTFVNSFDFSWFGIIGTNPTNTAIMNAIVPNIEAISSFSLSSDIIFSDGDVKLPYSGKIQGNNHKIKISASTSTEGLLIINQGTVLENITIESTNKDYNGVIVFFASKYVNVEVKFLNVNILGCWNEDGIYNTTGLFIKASNEYDVAHNYITGITFIGLKISWVSIGINIQSLIDPQYDRSLFLNELYFTNVYISAKQIGINTNYYDPNNVGEAAGPLHFTNYEFQAIVNTALSVRHSGKWTLKITDSVFWDLNIPAKVLNNGVLKISNVNLSYYGTTADGNDDDGEYTNFTGIRCYGNGKVLLDSLELSSGVNFPDNTGYNASSDTTKWQIKPENNALYIGRPIYKYYKIFNTGNYSHNVLLSSAGYKYYFIYHYSGRGIGRYILTSNWGINDDLHINSLTRQFNYNQGPSFLVNSYGTTEVYGHNFQLSNQINKNSVFEFRVKIGFRDANNNNITYTQYASNYNMLEIERSFNNINVHQCNVLDSHYEIIDDELYVYIICEANSDITWLPFDIDVHYKSTLNKGTHYTKDDTGKVTILDDGSWYVYRLYPEVIANNTRPTKPSYIGFSYYDNNLSTPRPIWYKGKENNVDVWVDATGTPV